ncbi:class I SAM-dependent methyltransferase [Maritalea porphyrae]|uniref:class I SAM-dependent methyltransferase n=1 Tax=Maritalea porphyrae TaxID=880732 RepID=UPI0022AFD1A5|nr:SAM-dependent methyltransferase [Maritalea porphyrae]MCZ4273603.1 SAM-dependent methyltransferase [Maritalea porphyrae]
MSDHDFSLSELINVQIMSQGPISLSTYMSLALTHPILGYYKKADPLGKAGDFITAPEISQMFGEMIGIWVAQTWAQLGNPKQFSLVELGPGRGTLMADCVRVLSQVPGILDAAKINLIETNPVLIEKQRANLHGHNVVWRSEIDQLSAEDGPLIFVANEFFDALPIKQFQRANGKWHERLVGLKGGARTWGLSPTPLPDDAFPSELNAEENAIWETNFIAQQVVKDIADLINRNGGALLAIDYGYGKSQTGETLQALKAHKHVDPLAEPGEVDLTAHVDFAALADIAKQAHAKTGHLITQAVFLKAMGIEPRAHNLASASPEAAPKILSDLARLIENDQMGELFKVWCLYNLPTPPYPFEAN